MKSMTAYFDPIAEIFKFTIVQIKIVLNLLIGRQLQNSLCSRFFISNYSSVILIIYVKKSKVQHSSESFGHLLKKIYHQSFKSGYKLQVSLWHYVYISNCSWDI